MFKDVGLVMTTAGGLAMLANMVIMVILLSRPSISQTARLIHGGAASLLASPPHILIKAPTQTGNSRNALERELKHPRPNHRCSAAPMWDAAFHLTQRMCNFAITPKVRCHKRHAKINVNAQLIVLVSNQIQIDIVLSGSWVNATLPMVMATLGGHPI